MNLEVIGTTLPRNPYNPVPDEDDPMDLLAPKRDAPQKPWLLLWSLHFYILGTVYLGLACYAFYSAAQSISRKDNSSGRVSSIRTCILAIKILLFVMGITRALYMYLYLKFWYDEGLPWKIVENILGNVSFPCLTGGFGLMCQILYEASRLKVRSGSTFLRNKVVLGLIITAHFIAVITAVTLIEILDNFILMLLICHGFFIVWGIFLVVTFIVFSGRLLEAEKKSSLAMSAIKETENVSYGISANDSSSHHWNAQNGQTVIHAEDGTTLNLCNNNVTSSRFNDSQQAHREENSPTRLPVGSEVKFAEKECPNGEPKVYGPTCARPGFRVKLTRKVVRIASVTAVLATMSVALNTLFVIKGLVFYLYKWSIPAAIVYVTTTLFRLVELGMGFTMAYFTTQSIKRNFSPRKSWLKRVLTRNRKYQTDGCRATTSTEGLVRTS